MLPCSSINSLKTTYILFELPFLSLHFIYFFRYYCSCNNFGQCDILARDFDFGPNPCPDTERYLEASYICVLGSENDHQMSSTYEGTYVLVREMSWTFFSSFFFIFWQSRKQCQWSKKKIWSCIFTFLKRIHKLFTKTS